MADISDDPAAVNPTSAAPNPSPHSAHSPVELLTVLRESVRLFGKATLALPESGCNFITGAEDCALSEAGASGVGGCALAVSQEQ